MASIYDPKNPWRMTAAQHGWINLPPENTYDVVPPVSPRRPRGTRFVLRDMGIREGVRLVEVDERGHLVNP